MPPLCAARALCHANFIFVRWSFSTRQCGGAAHNRNKRYLQRKAAFVDVPLAFSRIKILSPMPPPPLHAAAAKDEQSYLSACARAH